MAKPPCLVTSPSCHQHTPLGGPKRHHSVAKSSFLIKRRILLQSGAVCIFHAFWGVFFNTFFGTFFEAILDSFCPQNGTPNRPKSLFLALFVVRVFYRVKKSLFFQNLIDFWSLGTLKKWFSISRGVKSHRVSLFAPGITFGAIFIDFFYIFI